MSFTQHITRPMLASKCEQPERLSFPVLATPKLDGIRCLKVGGKALTRSFKPISNRFAREWIEANLPDGVDGELMLRGGTFSQTTSVIGSHNGEPDFVFHVFDLVDESTATPYVERMKRLAALPEFGRVAKVLPKAIHNPAELFAFEEECLVAGYEGVMVRAPESPYKCGRATAREGWLLKIKRFEDAEAEVIGTYEGLSNRNEAEQDAFGRTKRSTAKSGMVGRGELGGFIVRHLSTGVEFRLAYNHTVGGADSATMWVKRSALVGKVVKFSHQPSGADRAPRFPQFLGFREAWDLDDPPAKPIKPDKIISFPGKPVRLPPKPVLDEAEPQNIIVVEFDRDEYIVTASPYAL
jgi:DNA ligase-1